MADNIRSLPDGLDLNDFGYSWSQYYIARSTQVSYANYRITITGDFSGVRTLAAFYIGMFNSLYCSASNLPDVDRDSSHSLDEERAYAYYIPNLTSTYLYYREVGTTNSSYYSQWIRPNYGSMNSVVTPCFTYSNTTITLNSDNIDTPTAYERSYPCSGLWLIALA